MALWVLKFGGTSVATPAHIERVADFILKVRNEGHQLVIVVSAMAGETDRLVQLAYGINPKPSPQEYAVLLSTGEQITISLLALALQNRGARAQSLTGWQAGIVTDEHLNKARIQHIETRILNTLLQDGVIPIVAGFQGIDEQGHISILGRGGSDTTAVAIAAALNADECLIYTDVDGVYTADPRRVPEATRLDAISSDDMLELSSAGAKVLHARSVECAAKYHVPLRVLSSLQSGPGTLISHDPDLPMEHPWVAGVVYSAQEALVSLLGIPKSSGSLGGILDRISQLNVVVDMLSWQPFREVGHDLRLTVAREDCVTLSGQFAQWGNEWNAECFETKLHVSKLSMVGVGLRSHPSVSSKMFQLLSQEGIDIQLISISERRISVIIDECMLDQGLKALHRGFELQRQASSEEMYTSFS